MRTTINLILALMMLDFRCSRACWTVGKELGNIANLFNQRCFDGWGCFDAFGFKPLGGQLMFPDSPEEADVHFHIFQCRAVNVSASRVVRYNASDSILRAVPYDASKQTVVIVHGFGDHFDERQWMGQLKNLLFLHHCDRFNVIGVDWRNVSSCNYVNAVVDSPIVGNVIAYFLHRLINLFHQTPASFTLVGHSLGAHIAGFAGANFTEPKLKMIYGLDPAGPLFTFVDTKFRLDPSDAARVVTLSTNAGVLPINGQGLNIASGHFSLFVNGGYMQPGCHGRTSPYLNTLAESSSACSHHRPTKLIQLEFNTHDAQCFPMAYRCQSYQAFEQGECASCRDGSDDCKRMYSFFDNWIEDNETIKPDNAVRVYYVDTTHHYPYCIPHYQMIIETGEGDSIRGNWKITVVGDNLRTTFEFRSFSFHIVPNKSFKTLVKLDANAGRPKSFNIEMIQERGYFGTSSKTIKLRSIKWNYMSAPTQILRRKFSSTLTLGSDGNSTLTTDRTQVFTVKAAQKEALSLPGIDNSTLVTSTTTPTPINYTILDPFSPGVGATLAPK